MMEPWIWLIFMILLVPGYSSFDISCMDNCLGLLIAYDDNQPPYTHLCRSGFFCDEESLQCSKIKNCNEVQELECPYIGTFPDIKNCSKYYNCESISKATSISCPVGRVYDSKKGYCVTSSSCILPKCPNTILTPINIPYPNDDKFYVSCSRDSIIIKMCEEGTSFDFNSRSCLKDCVKEGYISMKEDHSQFILCRRKGKDFKRAIITCPPGYEFHTDVELCIEDYHPMCPIVGYFPDVLNCNRYFYCESPTSKARRIDCPKESYYDSKNETCSTAVNCVTVKCVNSDLGFTENVSYPSDDRFYVHCSEDKMMEIKKCKDGFTFDKISKMCLPTCKNEGFIPFPEGNKHIYCNKIRNNGFSRILFGCPAGYTFDTKSQTCEEDLIRECGFQGNIPDVLDCRSHIFCQYKGANAIRLDCPDGMIYNSKQEVCTESGECHNFSCAPPATNINVEPYEGDDRFFVWCDYETGVVNIEKCLGGVDYCINKISSDILKLGTEMYPW